jgi:C1A family cysteine protease
MGMKRLANGEWAILMQNSWSEKWGQKGYCWISEKNLGGWGWDAYSVVATTLDSTDRTPEIN